MNPLPPLCGATRGSAQHIALEATCRPQTTLPASGWGDAAAAQYPRTPNGGCDPAVAISSESKAPSSQRDNSGARQPGLHSPRHRPSAVWPQTPGRSARSPSFIDLVQLLLADKCIGLIHRLLQRGVKAVAPGRIRDLPGAGPSLAATASAPLGEPCVCWKWRRRVAGRRFGHAHRRLLLIEGDGSAILKASGLGPTR